MEGLREVYGVTELYEAKGARREGAFDWQQVARAAPQRGLRGRLIWERTGRGNGASYRRRVLHGGS